MFMMKREYRYTIQELEEIYPYERDIYVDLVLQEKSK